MVLLIEDDAGLRALYRELLTREGFRVREAEDGVAGLQRVDERLPALIILDLMLPKISGYGVLHDLGTQPHTRKIPVMVITGTIGTVDHPSVCCILRKPISAEALVTAVRRCCAMDAGAS